MSDKWRNFHKKNKGNIIFVFGVITVILIIIFLIFHNHAISSLATGISYLLSWPLYLVIISVSVSFGVMWNVLRRDLKDVPSAWHYIWLLESWILFPPLITTSFTLSIVASRNFGEVYRAQSPEMPLVSYPDVAGYSQFSFSAPTSAMWIASIFVYLLLILFFISTYKRYMRVKYEKPFYDSNGNLFFGREKKLVKPEFGRFSFFLIWLVIGLLNICVSISFLLISELHVKNRDRAELINNMSTTTAQAMLLVGE
jgi:hypothetical protein